MVSVIIPNYNHVLYLKPRIESILNQTYQDFEIIILDDCSTDESQVLILEYAALDARIRPVFNTHNSGSVFKQWDKGLKLATGEYIWIAESDDYAEPTFLETLVSALNEDEKIALAYSDSAIVDASGKPIGRFADVKKDIFNSAHWYQSYTRDGKQELRDYLSLQCTINNASAVLFRRSSIDASGGIDTSFRYAGDWFTYIKLAILGRIAYFASPLNNYREHGANASKSSFGNNSQRFERQKCFAFLYQSGALDKTSKEVMINQARIEFFDMQYQIIKDDRNYHRMLKMIAAICKISPRYYLKIQGETLKLTKLWQQISISI